MHITSKNLLFLARKSSIFTIGSQRHALRKNLVRRHHLLLLLISLTIMSFMPFVSNLTYSNAVIGYDSQETVPVVKPTMNLFTSSQYTLNFSTYLGGNNYDQGNGMAIDTNKNVYVIGETTSNNFPTKNAYNVTNGGNGDVFITKFDSANNLVFSTYLGGNNIDWGNKIVIDDNGNSYITGYTSSNNFPTKNAYNATFGGGSFYGDAFVAKFNSSGSLVFSTYFGGSDNDQSNGIAVDGNGNIYITGQTVSSNFPTKNSYQTTIGGSREAFIAKFS